MKDYVKKNAIRFLIANVVLGFFSYFFFLSVNSALPGSVDKGAGALTVTGILLVLLNVSFLITAFVMQSKRVSKSPVMVQAGLEILVFAILFWILIIFQ